jgi:uncharacterized protein YgiM (DUF1202 family)
MKRKRAMWLLMTMLFAGALAFMVAACASQKGTSAPGGGGAGGRSSQASQSRGGQSGSSGGATSGSSAQRSGADLTPLGDRVEIHMSWVQVRSAPSQDAAAIALVFGNDRLQVIETKGDWVHVKLDGNRQGWIPAAATHE